MTAITTGKDEYNLKPFFYAPLRKVDNIQYRHEVMQDLEDLGIMAKITAFAECMRSMREHLAQAQKVYYQRQKQRWFLDAVEIYCDAVTRLAYDLSLTELTSRGLSAFREYLAQYAASPPFTSLREQAKALEAELASIHYCVKIKGLSVQVSKYEGETDYSEEVEATFERFNQGSAKNSRSTSWTTLT